jgi:hypothetical protein
VGRVADPDLGSRIRCFLPPGSGIRIQDDFFPDPGSSHLLGEIILHYLQNLYVTGIFYETELLNLHPEMVSSAKKFSFLDAPLLLWFT